MYLQAIDLYKIIEETRDQLQICEAAADAATNPSDFCIWINACAALENEIDDLCYDFLIAVKEGK